MKYKVKECDGGYGLFQKSHWWSKCTRIGTTAFADAKEAYMHLYAILEEAGYTFYVDDERLTFTIIT